MKVMKISLLVATFPVLCLGKECDLFTYGNSKGDECGPGDWKDVVCENKQACVSLAEETQCMYDYEGTADQLLLAFLLHEARLAREVDDRH